MFIKEMSGNEDDPAAVVKSKGAAVANTSEGAGDRSRHERCRGM
jgi:hypothetical protein